jgi:hypothetical protein
MHFYKEDTMNEPIQATVTASQAEKAPPAQTPGNGNGPCAKPAPQVETAGNSRTGTGQFAKGNPGGPGNPFARQVAALRKALLESISAADIKAIAAKLRDLAKGGDIAAAKLLLAYTIGKPQPAVQPDNLDVEEWEHLKATAFKLRELPSTLGPGLDLPLTVARTARPGMASGMAGLLGACLKEPHRMPELVSAMFPPDDADGQPPSTNGSNRPVGPSTNGHKPASSNGAKRRLVNGKLVPA